MDYEQKYKEALERAKKWYNAPNVDKIPTYANRIIEELFPELKESEDEKIRKVLIELVKCNERCGYFMINNITTSSMLAWLEKQCEKKPQSTAPEAIKEENVSITNKIESNFNFKVGQWIVATGKCVYLIAKIDGCNVTLIDTNGDEYVFDASSLDNAYQWSITDAKDGDVLAAYECLVLFREIDGLNIRCYCTYHFMNNPSFHVETLHNKDAFHPATKEQRVILFKAIDKAGYTFDFEKKELKKIEQKPDEWSEKYKEAIEIGVIALDDLEPNDTYYGYTMPFGEAINWLKLLKDKVQPKQKDWSKEDEWKFFDILALLRGGENCHYNTPDLFEWFKSLKDRYTWKPSDEQMDALQYVYRNLNPPLSDKLGWNSLKTLELMFKQLKKLKE